MSSTEISRIREDVDAARRMIDLFAKDVDPQIRLSIDLHFAVWEAEGEEFDVKFLEGFFSGLMFAQEKLLHAKGSRAKATDLVSRFCIEAARKFVEAAERESKVG